MKTNEQWYPYRKFGSYFKLEAGELLQCPMNVDGSRDNSPGSVDFDRGVESDDELALRAIIKDLAVKD